MNEDRIAAVKQLAELAKTQAWNGSGEMDIRATLVELAGCVASLCEIIAEREATHG